MDVIGSTFVNETVHLDGNSYRNCHFRGCLLVYSGGGLPGLVGNTIQECNWAFESAADRTIAFLRALYHGGGEVGRTLVDNTVEEIMRGAPPTG